MIIDNEFMGGVMLMATPVITVLVLNIIIYGWKETVKEVVPVLLGVVGLTGFIGVGAYLLTGGK